MSGCPARPSAAAARGGARKGGRAAAAGPHVAAAQPSSPTVFAEFERWAALQLSCSRPRNATAAAATTHNAAAASATAADPPVGPATLKAVWRVNLALRGRVDAARRRTPFAAGESARDWAARSRLGPLLGIPEIGRRARVIEALKHQPPTEAELEQYTHRHQPSRLESESPLLLRRWAERVFRPSKSAAAARPFQDTRDFRRLLRDARLALADIETRARADAVLLHGPGRRASGEPAEQWVRRVLPLFFPGRQPAPRERVVIDEQIYDALLVEVVQRQQQQRRRLVLQQQQQQQGEVVKTAKKKDAYGTEGGSGGAAASGGHGQPKEHLSTQTLKRLFWSKFYGFSHNNNNNSTTTTNNNNHNSNNSSSSSNSKGNKKNSTAHTASTSAKKTKKIQKQVPPKTNPSPAQARARRGTSAAYAAAAAATAATATTAMAPVPKEGRPRSQRAEQAPAMQRKPVKRGPGAVGSGATLPTARRRGGHAAGAAAPAAGPQQRQPARKLAKLDSELGELLAVGPAAGKAQGTTTAANRAWRHDAHPAVLRDQVEVLTDALGAAIHTIRCLQQDQLHQAQPQQHSQRHHPPNQQQLHHLHRRHHHHHHHHHHHLEQQQQQQQPPQPQQQGQPRQQRLTVNPPRTWAVERAVATTDSQQPLLDADGGHHGGGDRAGFDRVVYTAVSPAALGRMLRSSERGGSGCSAAEELFALDGDNSSTSTGRSRSTSTSSTGTSGSSGTNGSGGTRPLSPCSLLQDCRCFWPGAAEEEAHCDYHRDHHHPDLHHEHHRDHHYDHHHDHHHHAAAMLLGGAGGARFSAGTGTGAGLPAFLTHDDGGGGGGGGGGDNGHHGYGSCHGHGHSGFGDDAVGSPRLSAMLSL